MLRPVGTIGLLIRLLFIELLLVVVELEVVLGLASGVIFGDVIGFALIRPVVDKLDALKVDEEEEMEADDEVLVLWFEFELAGDLDELVEETRDDKVELLVVVTFADGFGRAGDRPAEAPVSDKLAPIRLSAIMAVTAFCHLRLTTYFLSFVLSNCCTLPFLAGVLASQR